MTTRYLVALFLSAATPLWSAAVRAAEPAAVTADTHAGVYAAMERGADTSAMIDGMLASIRAQYAATPIFAELDRAHPGFLDAVIVAMRPTLEVYSERVRVAYRPRMIALLRAELSSEEAGDLIAFYETPLGRKVQQLASKNYRPDHVMANIARAEGPTAAEVSADIRAVSAATARRLTAEEVAALAHAVQATTAFTKLQNVMPKLAALRAEMEAQPTLPSEDRQLEVAIEQVFERYR